MQNIGDWRIQTNYIDAYNGRVWVLWDPSRVVVEEIMQNSQMVHCMITVLAMKTHLWATFIYARNDAEDRVELWEAIKQIAVNMVEPWILLGDLNMTLSLGERTRGGVTVIEDTSELEEVVTLNYGI